MTLDACETPLGDGWSIPAIDHSPEPPYRREMSFHLKRHATPPVDADDDYAARLRDLTPLSSDDTRPTGQDRTTYHSPIESFLEPVDKPTWLKPPQLGRRHRKHSD